MHHEINISFFNRYQVKNGLAENLSDSVIRIDLGVSTRQSCVYIIGLFWILFKLIPLNWSKM